jgi:translation elongation factor EF-4
MSVYGPSRHVAAAQQPRRFGSKADIKISAKISGTTPSSQRMCSAGTSGEGNKMRQFGKVDILQEAFIAALKVDS